MSRVIIDTSRLENASEHAYKTQRELNEYATELNRNIINSINRYDGTRTGNISSAQDKINQKIGALRTKANAYGRYGNKVSNYCEEVAQQEVRLVNKIARLFGSFKDRYNISEPGFWESIAIAIFGSEHWARIKNTLQHIGERIKNWYRYQGGKEIMEAVLSIAVAIAAVIAAVVAITAGCWIVVLAGAILAFIAFANAVTKTVYATQAVIEASKGVTHMATRKLYHSEGSFSDQLRRWGLDPIADFVDFTEIVCSVITFGAGLKKLVTSFNAAWMSNKGSFSKMISSTMTNIKDNAKHPFKFIGKLWSQGETKDKVKVVETGLSFLEGVNNALSKGEYAGIVDNGMKFFLKMGEFPIKVDGKEKPVGADFGKITGNITKLMKIGSKDFALVQKMQISAQNLHNFTYISGDNAFDGTKIGSYKLKDFASTGKFVDKTISNIRSLFSPVQISSITTTNRFAFAGGGGGGGIMGAR